MSNNRRTLPIQHLCRLLASGPADAENDAQLLRRFVTGSDESAFAELLRRHGPMVMGVCRRVLKDCHDAEDAFQATFLVLVRKGKSMQQWGSLGNWLHTVAFRLSLRMESSKLRAEPIAGDDVPAPAEPDDDVWRDLRPVLDSALERLPAKYRLPLVLCYFEGKTNDEAASQLGWPAGTVKCRLARGRDMLRRRLRKSNFAMGVAALDNLLPSRSPAAVPAVLAESTVKTVSAWLRQLPTAPMAPGWQASQRVLELSERMVQAMFLKKLKFAAALLVAVGVLAALSGGIVAQSSGVGQKGSKEPPDAPKTSGRPQPNARIPVAELTGHKSPAWALAFAPASKTLISASYDGVRQWDVVSGRQVARYPFGSRAVAISPDGKTFVVGRMGRGSFNTLPAEADGMAQFWDLASQAPVRRPLSLPNTTVDIGSARPMPRSVSNDFNKLMFAPDGRTLLSGNTDGCIRLWELASGKERLRISGKENKDSFSHPCLSSDGSKVAAKGSYFNEIHVWEAATGKEITKWQTGQQLTAMAFSPDGTRLLTGHVGSAKDPESSFRGVARLWDVATGKELKKLILPKGEDGIWLVAYAPDGKTFATASQSTARKFYYPCYVRLWDAATGKEIRKWADHMNNIDSLCFSPDGKLLASGGQDGVILLRAIDEKSSPSVIAEARLDGARKPARGSAQLVIRSAKQLKEDLGLSPDAAARLLHVDAIDFGKNMLISFSWMGVHEGPVELDIKRALRFKDKGATLEITFQRSWSTRKRSLGELHDKPGGALWLVERFDGNVKFKERPAKGGTGSEN